MARTRSKQDPAPAPPRLALAGKIIPAPVAAVALVIVIGCGWQRSPRWRPSRAEAPAGAATPRPLPRTGLQLRVEPGDAELFVDGRRVGSVSDLDDGVLELRAGPHQIMLRKAGYKPWRAEVAVRDRLEPMDIRLEQLPAPSR